MHMSINHIAEIMQRSTRTIGKHLYRISKKYKNGFDQRKHPPHMKRVGERIFKTKLAILQWCLCSFLGGYRDDIEVLKGEEPP